MKETLIVFICLFICIIFFAGHARSEIIYSPTIDSLYSVESDYIAKSNSKIGLELVDMMKVNLDWKSIKEHDVVDAEVSFPYVPEDLALVVLFDGGHVAQAQWDITSGHSLHVYFYKSDIEPFEEKEVIYLMIFRFENGLYYNLY